MRNNRSKKKVKAEWKDPLDDSELKELEKKDDFAHSLQPNIKMRFTARKAEFKFFWGNFEN